MAHVRTQIRNAVIAKLTGLTTTGNRVYKSRMYPMDDAAMPGICVYTTQEKISDDAPVGASKRMLDVYADAYVSGVSVDDTLDQIDAEVETAMFADYSLGGLTRGVSLSSVAIIYPQDAAKPFGVMRMIYQAEYVTQDGDPDNAL
jgi:hypothetical protein